ncbi:MAG TPA: GrpB family protein [Mycobacteriales bacterium]
MPSAEEITRHHDADPDEDPWVHGPPAPAPVSLVEYEPSWPDRYAALAGEVVAALGDVVLNIDHVGSTSVPGLAAKDVIDIDLTVADPRAEETYVPALEAIGWVHVIREPSWHEHRALSHSEPQANLHVFGPDCPETIRHRMFRDWLRSHPEDRRRYEDAKRAAVPGGGHVMDYNARKQDTIREIYDRLFRAAGLLP